MDARRSEAIAPKGTADREVVITGPDFREGGRWSYYMQGPEGEIKKKHKDLQTIVRTWIAAIQ